VRPRLDPQQIKPPHPLWRSSSVGTQSPGHHDNRRRAAPVLQSTLHRRGLVSHNPLLANLQARIEQAFGKKVALVLRISPRRTSSPMAKMAAVCGATRMAPTHERRGNGRLLVLRVEVSCLQAYGPQPCAPCPTEG